jgi:hypothetical protein
MNADMLFNIVADEEVDDKVYSFEINSAQFEVCHFEGKNQFIWTRICSELQAVYLVYPIERQEALQ